MALFGKKKNPEVQELVDSLMRSYLRGSAYGSHEKRTELVDEIAALVGDLRSNGSAKAVSSAESYHPDLLSALPPDAQRDFTQHLDRAFNETP